MIFKCVDFDDITLDIYSSLWEYGNLIDINSTTIIKFSSKKRKNHEFGGVCNKILV